MNCTVLYLCRTSTCVCLPSMLHKQVSVLQCLLVPFALSPEVFQLHSDVPATAVVVVLYLFRTAQFGRTHSSSSILDLFESQHLNKHLFKHALEGGLFLQSHIWHNVPASHSANNNKLSAVSISICFLLRVCWRL